MNGLPANTLTFEQWKKAADWIDEKKVICEVCHPYGSEIPTRPPHELFSIPQHLFTPLLFVNGGAATAALCPQFMAACTKCGNTKYFNAIQANIIPNPFIEAIQAALAKRKGK